MLVRHFSEVIQLINLAEYYTAVRGVTFLVAQQVKLPQQGTDECQSQHAQPEMSDRLNSRESPLNI